MTIQDLLETLDGAGLIVIDWIDLEEALTNLNLSLDSDIWQINKSKSKNSK